MAQPKNYLFKFIEPGIISYKDKNAGTVLVSKEALDRMGKSFKGCPIIFIPEMHDDSDKENSFNFEDGSSEPRQGIISSEPFWEDGWQWVEGIVWDEDTQIALDKAIAEQEAGKDPSMSCSCSYMTDEVGEGGIWHELPYDETVEVGHYMHMAIVPRPRYEGSRVFANSKGGPNLGINLFKKKNAAPPEPTPKKPDEPAGPAKPDAPDDPAKPAPGAPAPAAPEKKVLENDDATEVDVNGTRVPLHELISDYVEKHGAGEPAGEEIAPDTLVNLPDGTQVSIQELIDSYAGGEGGGEPDTAMENSADADDKGGDSDTKPNGCGQKSNAAPAKRVVNKALQNAAKGGDNIAIDTPMTKTERAALGRERYGLGKKEGGEE